MRKPLISLFGILVLVTCNKPHELQQEKYANFLKDTSAVLFTTFIADLPDSLQPEIIELVNRPEAKKFTIPKIDNSNYSIKSNKEKQVPSMLNPPVSSMVPVLKNEAGIPLLDRNGEVYILGKGGQSHFTNYNTDNGLALDLLYCSLTDKRGNIWFGSSGGGVSRYDGYSFTNFTTAHGLGANMIVSIFEDKQGNIWIGTIGGGVTKYDGVSFTNYDIDDGLVNNSVKSITEDRNGNLYFGTEQGLSFFNGKAFTTLVIAPDLENISIRGLTCDKRGHIWITTYGAGISMYDGKTFKRFNVNNGLANDYLWGILEDKTGKIWIATNAGVSSFEGNSIDKGHIRFTNYTTEDGLASNHVISILEDRKGNLWFGTNGNGISKYDGTSFTSFTTDQGLPNNVIRSITEDMRGNLWISTYGGGASKYEGEAFTSYTMEHGLSNNLIWSILEDKSGNLWFGTHGGGVSMYNGRTFTNFTMDQGLANNIVHSICEDNDGMLWLGTEDGLSRYDGQSFVNYTTEQGLANNFIYSIIEDKDGNLWIGTEGGASRFDGESFTNYTIKQGLTGNWVYGIIEDKRGNLWFGSYSNGISRYDGISFTNFTTDNGLSNNSLNGLYEDRVGNLWFGTEEGLSLMSHKVVDQLNQKTTRIKSNKMHSVIQEIDTLGDYFINFTRKDGLPDNFAAQILQLPSGKIALGTNLGFTFFNLSEDYERLTDIELYNSNTYYPVKDVNSGHNCMYLDRNGIIWAGTGSAETALVRFDYSTLNRNNNPPPLVIRSVKINEEAIAWYNLKYGQSEKADSVEAAQLVEEVTSFGLAFTQAQRDSMSQRFGDIRFDDINTLYPVPQNLILPYRFNNLTIDFSAVETGKPQLVKYQYILEGYQNEWSPLQKKTSATFGNINEGKYTFKVKALSPDGIWCEPVLYEFRVLPPWYRTWLAYLVYVSIFILVLILFSKYRERQLLSEKEKLENIVKERTEELVKKNILIQEEMHRSDELLLNILPEEVAKELKSKGSADAQLIDHVTVLFTDFKDFTSISEKLSPHELVSDIHECFSAFDRIVEKYGVEKIKTIGDSYMAAGGLPIPNQTHTIDVVHVALEIQAFMKSRNVRRKAENKPFYEIRIGIHTGPVVAGIVGIKKFQYDIWGDTVNTASRMESNGVAGSVNISNATYKLVKDIDKLSFVSRGLIEVKGKGKIEMWFVERKV